MRYGSLVISTSPSTNVSVGCSARIAPAARARLLMWPGVPVTAWATIRPRRSNTALARSPASRTIGENAARWSARACSLTVAMRLCHSTSSSIGSNVIGAHLGDQRAVGRQLRRPARPDHDGRLALLDDRRAGDPLADAESLAAVDGRVERGGAAREAHRAGAASAHPASSPNVASGSTASASA